MPEKIEILAILAQDADEAIRSQALATLAAWDAAELRQVFLNPETPAFLLEFAVRHLVQAREELAPALLGNSALAEELRSLLRNPTPEGSREKPCGVEAREEAAETPASQKETLLQKISRMSVAEKVNAALMGSQEERAVLVRDSNKVVSRAVLESPKLSDREIENISMMKNVSEEVLRRLAANRKFIRGYAVVHNLVNNPRAPIDVSLPFVPRLNESDLKELARNKNVPEVLRRSAAKLLKQKAETKTG